MNLESQMQLIGVSIAFSAAFFLLLYAMKRLLNAELKGEWGLVAAAAFPFLAYAILSILSTDILKKEIGLSVGVVNINLIKDSSITWELELSFGQNVKADAVAAGKGTGAEVSYIIKDARRGKYSTLLVDAGKYIIDLKTVDKYASKSGYLFKHVVFVKSKKFLGYTTPQDIDWYLESEEFDEKWDFSIHLKHMPVQNDVILNTTSEREALEIMKKRRIDTIAVIDSKSGNYRGLASRQQITESMLTQVFKQVGKAKSAESRPVKDETLDTLKGIKREIIDLHRLQSQQFGFLQGVFRGQQIPGLEQKPTMEDTKRAKRITTEPGQQSVEDVAPTLDVDQTDQRQQTQQ